MFAASRAVVLLVLICAAGATLGNSLESAPRPLSMTSQPKPPAPSSLHLALAPSTSGMSQWLAFPVTCFFFFFEALLHFHIGKTGQLGLSMPNSDELFKLVISIVICSGLSSGTVMLIESILAKRRVAASH